MEEQIEETQPSARLTYEERKNSKKAAKEGAHKNVVHGKQTKQFGTYAILILAVIGIGAGIFFFVQKQAPKGEDFSTAVPVQGRSHIDVGSAHESYNSNPPSSGSHYSNTARVNFYEETVRDENIIHNLEHGDIWIAYHPRISAETKDQLKRIQGTKVIVTQREANDFDISLVAWGRVDSFNLEGVSMDEQRVGDFIKRYINKGPERSNSSFK